MSKQHDMEICLAVDCYASKEFGAFMPSDQLMALKFAVMQRMGVSNKVHILSAVEGSELVDFEHLLRCSRVLLNQPQQKPIFDTVETGARTLMRAYATAKGAA